MSDRFDGMWGREILRQAEAAEPKVTLTADEVFEQHPLPWTHHLLLIKDANDRQVIHTGGLYSERGRLYEGKYLSGLNAMLVEAVNMRVSAAPVVDDKLTESIVSPNGDLWLKRKDVMDLLNRGVATSVENAENAAKPDTYRLMMEHYAEAGKQIIESIESLPSRVSVTAAASPADLLKDAGAVLVVSEGDIGARVEIRFSELEDAQRLHKTLVETRAKTPDQQH